MDTLYHNTNHNSEHALTLANPKVTVAFRCPASLKLRLTEAAGKQGLTTSEFAESLLMNFEDIENFNRNGGTTDNRVVILGNEVSRLNDKLSKYECPQLLRLFRKFEGREINFTSYEGAAVKITVQSPYDVYRLLINSFKPVSE